MTRTTGLITLAATAALLAACASSPKNPMSFFVTSVGGGKGADLGGLAGADAHCEKLAAAVGAGGANWHAYLSTTGAGGVDARERIGKGPWQNAKGVVIASDVATLHGSNNLTKETALNEKGEPVNGRTDKPNTHDMLTGSTPDGRAMDGSTDSTCGNWTKSGEGVAIVGHHDRAGLRDDEPSRSWNSSHPSRACSQDALKATGGDGLFYCFAAK
jgi:hypothetical protein